MGIPLPKGYEPTRLPRIVRAAWDAEIAAAKNNAQRRMIEWKWYCRYMRYAIEDLLWIKSQSREIVPTRLNNIQRHIVAQIMWDWMHERPIRYVIGPKPRRIGATTIVSEVLHILTRFNRNSQSLIMMNNSDTTDMVFRWHKLFNTYIEKRVRVDIEQSGMKLDEKRKQRREISLAQHALYLPIRKDNERMIQWYDFNPDLGDWLEEGGSYIRMVTGGSAHGAVGDAFQFIHYGEIGDDSVDWDSQTKANDRTVPDAQVTPYTAIIKEGATYLDETSKVVTGVYLQKTVDAARNGKSGYRHLFYPWFEHDVYRLPLEPNEKVEIYKGFRNKPESKKRAEEELEETRGLIWHRWRIDKLSEPYKTRAIEQCEAALNYQQKVLWPEIEGDFDWMHSQYPAYTEQAFVSRTQNYFDGVEINKRLETVRADPKGRIENEWLVTYRDPEENTEYIIAGDPSSGSGDDYSGALVFNTRQFSIDAVWQGKEATPVQAEQWAELGYRYSTRETDHLTGKLIKAIPALLVPEANSYGNEVIRVMRDELRYPNIWRRKPLDRKAGKQGRGEYGFWTGNKAGGGGHRDLGLAQAKVQWQTWEIHDERVLRQLANFGYKKNSDKPQATQGGDEFITCIWILSYVCAVLGYTKDGTIEPSQIENISHTKDYDLDTLLDYLQKALYNAKRERENGKTGSEAKIARIETKIAEINARKIAEVQQAEPWRAWFKRNEGSYNADWRVRGII